MKSINNYISEKLVINKDTGKKDFTEVSIYLNRNAYSHNRHNVDEPKMLTVSELEEIEDEPYCKGLLVWLKGKRSSDQIYADRVYFDKDNKSNIKSTIYFNGTDKPKIVNVSEIKEIEYDSWGKCILIWFNDNSSYGQMRASRIVFE